MELGVISLKFWGGHGNPLQYPCLENSMDRDRPQSMGSQRVGRNWVPNIFTFYHKLTQYMWVYFWAYYSVLLIYLCVFMPVPYCFNYYSFEIHFVIRKHLQFCSFSRLLWLFGVFCGSVQILWLFELFLWIMSMEFWYWLHWACWLLCVVWTI